jgi:hypothetical protein
MLSNPLYIKECERVVNYMLTLSLVCKYDFRTQDLNSIRIDNGKRLNDEIVQFFKKSGGVEAVYNMFKDSFVIKDNHIILVWNYINKYRVQPHKLRSKTDFEMVKIPVFFEYIGE